MQWGGIGPERALGCVVYPAAEIEAPGIVRHVEGNRFSLGEPTGERSERALRLSEALTAAGLKAPVRSRIRDEILGEALGQPLVQPDLRHHPRDPRRALHRSGHPRGRPRHDARGRGHRHRARRAFPIDVDRRIDAGAAVGPHRTSMLQDLEAGRPLEIDALVASVQELGRLTATPTPTIDTVLALIRLRARSAASTAELSPA